MQTVTAQYSEQCMLNYPKHDDSLFLLSFVNFKSILRQHNAEIELNKAIDTHNLFKFYHKKQDGECFV